LEKWIQSGTSYENVTEAIMLESHYKFDQANNMVALLDVINKEMITSLLQDNATSTITVICISLITKDIVTIWK
jgi:hypothetical protein